VSGSGQPALEPLDGRGLRVAIAASRWHDRVMGGLVAGAQRALDASHVQAPTLVRASGCFELPVVVRALVDQGYDAVVALGVVVRGGTPHFDYVCRAVTDGLARVILDSGVPVGFGILTCDDDAQALDRAGLPASREDKGFEAAHAAVETALTLRRLRAHDG
jgi:6,7-dimethyl-8-ribityllumazine synthase